MIEEYKFGSITINGKTFEHDIELRWDGEVLKWWRGESHVVDSEDIERAIEQGPELIILGTGAYGLAQVTDRAKEVVKNRGIELIIDNTEQAVKTFNILQKKGEKVIGLFHLTC